MSMTITKSLGRQIEGGGYGKPPGTSDEFLTRVGPGTPGGEFLRRYWHPVGVSDTVTGMPQRVRVLGEDLILFRDGKGRAGLLHARCCHRGTTLYYGKVEESGIRCCYHGWLFDVEGHCLDQPCEPEGGLHRDKARQPWYPVEERYGLVFAYMGPLDRKPPLPRYDTLENLGDDEHLEQDRDSFYVGGGRNAANPNVPYNWLQDYENVLDPFHVVILHARFSGVQFREELGVLPKVDWDYLDHGVATNSIRDLGGRTYRRITQVLLPNIRIVPSIEMTSGKGREVAWLVPADDTSHRSLGVARVPNGAEPLYTRRSRLVNHDGKLWTEMTDEEHRLFPDDYEAQLGQGPITFHSEERLATTDRGIVMLRRLLARQIKAVEEGNDPIGAGPNGAELIEVKAGNFFLEETNAT
jgi:nitrite reductase/ring-hydroxylating ferredoxin subunit